MRQEHTEMQEQINHLNYLLNKLKQELADKDNMIGRSLHDTEGEAKMLRQQLEHKKQENSQLQGQLR